MFTFRMVKRGLQSETLTLGWRDNPHLANLLLIYYEQERKKTTGETYGGRA